jgi:osmotically-inducible protein OsmY
MEILSTSFRPREVGIMAQTERRRSEDIRADVSSQLFWDNRIDESNINVDVVDGRVILTGTVPTYSDRWQAENDAYSITGVRYVDNRLRVSPTTFPAPSDTEIATNIRKALEWNPTIDSSRIYVSVSDGIVTLSGAVDSYWQKTRAGYLASNVGGVVDVVNLLRVEPVGAETDDDIRRDVLTTLARNTFIDAGRIDVRVEGGAVTLTGTVDDFFSYRTAEDVAKFTSGVVDVHNDLVII